MVDSSDSRRSAVLIKNKSEVKINEIHEDNKFSTPSIKLGVKKNTLMDQLWEFQEEIEQSSAIETHSIDIVSPSFPLSCVSKKNNLFNGENVPVLNSQSLEQFDIESDPNYTTINTTKMDIEVGEMSLPCLDNQSSSHETSEKFGANGPINGQQQIELSDREAD